MRRNKYSKLPSDILPSTSFGEPPLILHFRLQDGRLQKIDLTFFIEGNYPRPLIAGACAEVFWLDMQGDACTSRENILNKLRRFNKFLDWRAEGGRERQISSTLEFSSELFIEYQSYLDIFNKQLKESTSAGFYQAVSRFFTRMRMVRPERLSSNLQIPANSFRHLTVDRSIDGIISLKDLKLITEAAIKEVKEIRENHLMALKLLESASINDAEARMKRKPHSFWKSMSNALYYLVRVGGINSISETAKSAITNYGHPPTLKMIGWYAPTSDEYFIPFLVLLYLHTAINVTSIYTLRRDCLAEHPLPLGLTICKFTKPRSRSMSNKELSFPSNQPNGPIDIIRFLIEYTQPWVEHASDAEKGALFIYYSRRTGVRSSGRTFTSNSLARFIARNNLPHFSFDQLRPTIASMIYLQTRDIFRVQRLLSHSSIRTTTKYIRGALVHAQYDREMANGIDAMVERVTGAKKHSQGVSVFTEPMDDILAAKIEAKELSPKAGEQLLNGGCNTLVGRCKDPLNSPQPGEIKGRVCRSLHACLFCDNCWIFAEDLVETIKYRNALEAEKEDTTSEIWEALHGDAVREINNTILSGFPSEVVAKAELEARQVSMPV